MARWLQIILLIFLGLFVGFVNGFLGAGGGMLLVPSIIAVLKMDAKKAHATAILIILPICVASGIVYVLKGAFDLGIFIPCLIGTIIGGVIGTFILKKLKSQIITLIFSGVMIAAGVIMVVRAI
ncbi:MAG: sulfite exporter TauE/SafE family protein [Clostridia bacterium]|nr:sulfite exporter TauE/SafE family protein [Clostridia bacterium]